MINQENLANEHYSIVENALSEKLERLHCDRIQFS